MKLSDYVFAFVAARGVKHVFMLPGGGAMHLVDSVGRCPGLAYVCNLHEQASAVAAEAYARVTNNLGVALVTTGPGGTNATTGVAAAWLDSTPCLFISGQVKRADLKGGRGVRMLGVQEIDIVSLVTPITKYAVTVMDPQSIRYHLEQAVHLARSGRPGPVWLDIPLDVQAAQIEPETLAGFDGAAAHEPADPGALAQQAQRVVALLRASARPVVLVGNGVRLAGAQAAFVELVERLRVPVLTTRLGVDLLAADHELCFGMPGTIASRGANFTLQNADLLIILGARLDMALIAYAPEKLARGAKKVMVNVDPAEIEKVAAVIDVPVRADCAQFIDALLRAADPAPRRDPAPWLERCRDWKRRYPFVLPEHRAAAAGVSVYAFAEALGAELGPEHIVLPGNAGNSSEIFLTAFATKAGQRVFHNKGTGAMGFCQPAAIGACLGGGGRPTVCVDGDGGFQLNIQELETVRRLALPITFFVMNNHGYGSIRAMQQGYFGQLTGADDTSGLTLPDVVKVARAYGLATARITGGGDLRAQIREVLALRGPVVCDVEVLRDEARAPRVTAVQQADGSMVSKPLEDMWPFLEREEFRANMIEAPAAGDAPPRGAERA
jgi:acetolactate synthase-1/2/3 large subunit